MEKLPIDEKIPEILDLLNKSKNLVISAEPGSGKTTRIPPALTKITDQKILVLEPRRIAVSSSVNRIAEEQGWNVGEKIGYQIRFDNRTNSKTQLIFLTEAMLARQLLNDPKLRDVKYVVLDEFHERSIHTDLAIGLLAELQQLERPDLKIIVMSATIEVNKIKEYLPECESVLVSGKKYELTKNYIKEAQLINTGPQFIDRVCQKIKAVSLGFQSPNQSPENKQDILVFLPGSGEINRTARDLEDWSQKNKILVLPLHGQMKIEEQMKVLQTDPLPKIILSTNVAESAVTVNGVRIVIDCGLARSIKLNTTTGVESLEIQRISRASAKQRAGRAARQGPGQVFHLWSKTDELSMPDYNVAEIHRIELSDTVLYLANLGIQDFSGFTWFEKPEKKKIEQAVAQLRMIFALDEKMRITVDGKRILQIPLPNRLAKFFIELDRLQFGPIACDLCAILNEKDFLRGQKSNSNLESDLLERYEYFLSRRTQGQFGQINKLSQMLESHLIFKTTNKDLEIEKISKAALLAFPDRICRRRRKAESLAQMSNGKGVILSENTSVQKSDFFMALGLIELAGKNDPIVTLATKVERVEIEKLYSDQIIRKKEIVFDQERRKLISKEVIRFQNLTIDEFQGPNPTAEELQNHLPQVARAQWAEILQKNESLRSWLERFDFFRRSAEAELNPELNPEFNFDEFISVVIEQASYGENSIESLAQKDWTPFLEQNLNAQLLQKFAQGCPQTITVPTGSKIKINYFSDKNPTLEVRLQELFGMPETPKIMKGKVPITLHLLGPNYRPVQVTEDLGNFWKKAYHEVRKELRARYPKHSWPDDPMTAKPEAKGRRRT